MSDHLKFPKGPEFHGELKRRVHAYFAESGLAERDQPGMYLKTVFILAWGALSFIGMNWFATEWWQVALLAVSLGLSMAGLGFNIQHDGNHGGYSESTVVNKAMAYTLDFIGGSSYVWHWKHNIVHHTYTNIAHVDADTEVGFFARLTPHHTCYPAHRFQHLYVWFLYMLLPFKWIFFDDARDVISGHIGTQRFPRPSRFELTALVLFKIQYVLWAIVLPLTMHPWINVAAAYTVAAITLGFTLALVFQLAHCVALADFPIADQATGKMEQDWARHQVATTVDFARDSALLTWFLGGLNFQVEHHLFPRISHVHYPAISRIVEATCKDYGVRFRAYPTMSEALVAHAKWLKFMGSGADVATAPVAMAPTT